MRAIKIDNQEMTRYVTKYSQEVADQFGFYRATLDMSGTRDQLEAWFSAFLFAGVAVEDSGTMFEGRNAEMVLTLDGRPVTVSILDGKKFFNRVNVLYRPPQSANIDENLLETGWIENPDSIAAFGVFEQIIKPAPVMVNEGAVREARRQLSDFSYPRKVRGRYRSGVDDGLSLVVVGRYDLANRRFVTIPPAPDGIEPEDVDPILVTDYVRQIIDGNPWMRPGEIDDSTAMIQVVEQNLSNRYVPAWTRLQELAEMASTDGVPFMVQSWEDGRVDFVRKSADPVYFYTADSSNYGDLPTNSRPGMARDTYESVSQSQAGTWYQSAADYWIETVEYSDDNGTELVPAVEEADKFIAAVASAT